MALIISDCAPRSTRTQSTPSRLSKNTAVAASSQTTTPVRLPQRSFAFPSPFQSQPPQRSVAVAILIAERSGGLGLQGS